jgi:hypothetical protein
LKCWHWLQRVWRRQSICMPYSLPATAGCGWEYHSTLDFPNLKFKPYIVKNRCQNDHWSYLNRNKLLCQVKVSEIGQFTLNGLLVLRLAR